MRRPEISVILPICHGGNFLKSALESLCKMEFPRECFEVLFAGPDNDEELQHTVESESTNAKIDLKYIRVVRSNRSAQLNAAISQARGHILVFADDDCIFLPDWLYKVAKVFERETNIGVVGGLDRTGKNEPTFNIALDYVLNSFLGTGGLRRIQGPRVGKYYPKLWNMVIPREVALGVAIKSEEGMSQVFNETLDVHEDVELIYRIEKTGKRIVYAPDVIVMHSRDTTLSSFTIRSFNMARTSRSVGVHRLPHVSLSTFALGIIALTIASIVSQPLRIVLAVVSIIYGVILLVSASGGFMRTRLFSVFYYVPLLLIALHFSRGLGYLFPWRESD
jgi:cellulose synthase/poly-beta-1,6-N-acetylglucosamine synthase-like glycosyltransferase